MPGCCGDTPIIDTAAVCALSKQFAAGGDTTQPGITLFGADAAGACKKFTVPASAATAITSIADTSSIDHTVSGLGTLSSVVRLAGAAAGYSNLATHSPSGIVTGIQLADEAGTPGTVGAVVPTVSGNQIRIWRNYVRSVRASIGSAGLSPAGVINNPSSAFLWYGQTVAHAIGTYNVPKGAIGASTLTILLNGGGIASNTVRTTQDNTFAAVTDVVVHAIPENASWVAGTSAAVSITTSATMAVVTGAPSGIAMTHAHVSIAGSGG